MFTKYCKEFQHLYTLCSKGKNNGNIGPMFDSLYACNQPPLYQDLNNSKDAPWWGNWRCKGLVLVQQLQLSYHDEYFLV